MTDWAKLREQAIDLEAQEAPARLMPMTEAEKLERLDWDLAREVPWYAAFRQELERGRDPQQSLEPTCKRRS